MTVNQVFQQPVTTYFYSFSIACFVYPCRVIYLDSNALSQHQLGLQVEQLDDEQELHPEEPDEGVNLPPLENPQTDIFLTIFVLLHFGHSTGASCLNTSFSNPS